MVSESLQQQAQRVLEWPALLQCLSAHANSSLGREHCQSLPLEHTQEQAQERLQETTEMVGILTSDLPLPALAFQDIRPMLDRAGKGSVLEGYECHAISGMLRLMEGVHRCLAHHQQDAPLIWKRISHVVPPSHLRQNIDRCVDPDGNILDTASQTLKGLIHETNTLKHRIRQRLEEYLHSQHYEDVLQEQYFVQRESRFVLPVKTDQQSRLPGIVHDVSGSGATVFIEPRELVELNNRIKLAELHITREIRRILADLTASIAEQQEEIAQILALLTTMDCLVAKARLSQMIQGRSVSLNAQGRIVLRGARHPLLMMAKESVVPNDLILDEQVRVCVISGPNTGGKTVTLKLLGLFALMVRAGLHLPCGEGAAMGFFPNIYADIGDAQDLTHDLSSFSAHVMTLINILHTAQSTSEASDSSVLVLLDEIGGSTDPMEGAALAEVVLRKFVERGFKAVVTTHYHSLKMLAYDSPHFVNASLEFDGRTLAPTYRVIQGLPGGSSAIDIAGRLGMDPVLLEEAASLVQPETRRINHMIQELQETQSQLAADRLLLQEQRREAERITAKANMLAEQFQSTERREIRQVRKRLHEALAEAKKEIQQIVRQVKEERSALKLGQAHQVLHTIEQDTFPRVQGEDDTIPLEQLQRGDHVTILSMDSTGVLLEIPQGKKRVRVQVGHREVSVERSNLVGRATPSNAGVLGRHQDSTHLDPRSRSRMPPPDITSFGTVDLRGQAVDEALETLLKTLDQSALQNIQVLRIIHGHGTGKLKAAVRAYCAQTPEISSFKAGGPGEGGDGVTIAKLDHS